VVLDDILDRGVIALHREMGGVLSHLRALRIFQEIVEWAGGVAPHYGLRKPVEASLGCEALIRDERLRLGLKVPGPQVGSPSVSAEGRVGPGGTMCPPAKRECGVQTRGTTRADAAVGCDPVRLADVGVQASSEPQESPTARKKRRRNRGRGGRLTSASASSSSSDVEPLGASTVTGGGDDMPAAGISERGGRKQEGTRGEVAKATPPPPASGPSYAAAAMLPPGGLRPSPCATATGGSACRGEGKEEKVISGGDAASRESRSGSPPLPRPKPKRKKGMRTPGSSVPVEIRFGVTDLDRDVTAREFLRAVSLLCGPGVLLLGPVRRADGTPSPPSKEGEMGSGDCVGAGLRGGVRVGASGPRRPPHYKPSPPVGGKARCWGCGVAGHLLRSCPSVRGGSCSRSQPPRRRRGAPTGGLPPRAGVRPGVVPPVASRPSVGPTPAPSRPGLRSSASSATPRTATAQPQPDPAVARRDGGSTPAPCAAGPAILGVRTAAGKPHPRR